jgi:hypothetical protein
MIRPEIIAPNKCIGLVKTPASKLMGRLTMKVKITGMYRHRVRMFIFKTLILIACRVLGCGVRIAE